MGQGGSLQGEQEKQKSAFSEQKVGPTALLPAAAHLHHESTKPMSHELEKGAQALLLRPAEPSHGLWAGPPTALRLTFLFCKMQRSSGTYL